MNGNIWKTILVTQLRPVLSIMLTETYSSGGVNQKIRIFIFHNYNTSIDTKLVQFKNVCIRKLFT